MVDKSVFRAVDIETIDLQSGISPTESHVTWKVGIAPEAESDLGGRVVYGTLHAYGPSGGGEVTVAGLILHYPSDLELSVEQFREGIEESDALECFYDAARMALRVATAIVSVAPELPVKAPAAVFGLLQKRNQEASDTDLDDVPAEGTEVG